MLENVKVELIEKLLDSVPAMILYLNKLGFSEGSIERALDLPMKTLEKLKNKPSAALKALLRILVHYPWMIEVTDNKYDPVVAETELVMAILKEIEIKNARF